MKSLFKRASAAVRWLRPYATFVIGGLFIYAASYQWISTSDENMAHDFPVSLTFALWAVGLLIIGRANQLRRTRSQ